MAQIIINGNITVNGNVTFNRAVNEEKTGFIISGVLSTHLYFEDIKTIEMRRYKLTGVEVYQESYGSDDYNIGYFFTCKNIEVLGQDYNGAKFILYPSEMKMIEDEMYKDEHPVLGNIGKVYKDMVKQVEEEGSDE
jgi:hypothetical protein